MDGVKCSASRSFYPSLQHCGGEGGCALTKHTHRLKGKESDGCGFFGSFSRRRSITRIIIICVLLYFNEWNVSYPWINLRVISKTDPRRTMDVVILYFFLFVELTHGLRYDGSNNLQPYMWVYFFFFFLELHLNRTTVATVRPLNVPIGFLQYPFNKQVL